MSDRIFISYSHRDTEVANAIRSAIEAAGRRCWIAPRDIEPSSEWAEQIIDGINASGVMVLVFSSSSNRSPQVRREVERAVNRDMPIVPFRIEQVLPAKSLEYFLSTQHWFDAFDGATDRHVARLCALVGTLADRRAATGRTDDRPLDPKVTDLTASFASAPPIAQPEPPAWRDDDLAFVTRELARHIGPIARYLVQRASRSAPTASALIDTLAAEFTEPRERAAFASACRQRFGG